MTRAKEGTSVLRLRLFCEEMVQHFGGADAFMAAWKAAVDRDLETGGLPAFRHFALLLRFMESCDPLPVYYSRMSDEELFEKAAAMGVDPFLP